MYLHLERVLACALHILPELADVARLLQVV
jgi:hypothetical protein